jgi:hypothetical protein
MLTGNIKLVVAATANMQNNCIQTNWFTPQAQTET